MQTLPALLAEVNLVLMNNDDYFQVLANIKAAIKSAQYRAVLGANREQIALYWNIGKIILNGSRFGNKFIENLARDI